MGARQAGGGERDADLLAADGVAELVAREVCEDSRPGGQQLPGVVLELVGDPPDLGVEVGELRFASDFGIEDLLEQVPQIGRRAVAVAGAISIVPAVCASRVSVTIPVSSNPPTSTP